MLLRSASVLALAVACSTAEPGADRSGSGDAGGESAGRTSAQPGGAAGAGGLAGGENPGNSSAGDDGNEAGGAGGASGGSAGTGGEVDSGGAESTGGDAGASGTSAAYAHVTAVSVSGSDGAYTFNVSIESADVDCTQFADFWEVLGEDGALLYRRILEHSHTDENGTTDPDAPGNTFTRGGGPVAVDSSRVVVVRAHMSTTGYNGRVMRGSVDAGFAVATDIDSTFAADVEDDMPLPTGCLF